MSARSPQPALNPNESFNLAPVLRDCLSPGVVVVSHDERILSCTSVAENLLGFNPGQITLAAFPQLPTTLRALIRDALTHRASASISDLPIHLGNHQPSRIFHLNIDPIHTSTGEFAVVVTLTDSSGIARIQQSLERLDRLATAGTLAASMAHEIKNALVAVKTFVDLLLEKNKDEELASLVGREMDRVNAIVRQLLKFGGVNRPIRHPVRLHDVLEHSLRMVKHQLDGKLISLHRSFKATSDTISGDNHQLEQVFVNLFLNAVDATGSNGSLIVETELISTVSADIVQSPLAGQPHILIKVADTGAGIAPEHLAQMFEPFFTTKNHGTGLGLPITRRIVLEHQGQITVESQPNKGTTFNIFLPAGQSLA